jgi:hypothetical protein
MFASRSEANMESKDPDASRSFAVDARHSLRAVEREFPDTGLPVSQSMGSFDYARLRFANSRFAQDDSGLL